MHPRTHTFINLLAPKHTYSHVDSNTYTCTNTPKCTSTATPKTHRFKCSFEHTQPHLFTKHPHSQASFHPDTQLHMQIRARSTNSIREPTHPQRTGTTKTPPRCLHEPPMGAPSGCLHEPPMGAPSGQVHPSIGRRRGRIPEWLFF